MKTAKLGFVYSSAVAAGLLGASVGSAHAQSVQQLVVNNVIQNILQNVRDQIQGRRLASPPGVMRFSAEVGEFDNHNPFGSKESDDPFHALGYAKSPVYTKAPAAAAYPAWIYGVNLIGSYDRSNAAIVGTIDTYTVVGAFDVTKIGIFTASDALTFVATGTNSWSHYFGTDITSPSGSGTLAYTNGGFSTDFTASASWSRVSSIGVVAASPDSSSMSYTANGQYKFDFPYTVFVEPTAGVTYTENYTANFGTKTSDSTEVHGGVRLGFDTKWIGYTIQPSWTVVAMKIVDQSGVGAVGGIGGLPPGALGGAGVVAATSGSNFGGRTSAKINVIWTPAFSSYIEAHATEIAGTTTAGAQGGLRYTW